MTAHSLAAYLIDFSAPRRRPAATFTPARDVDAEIAIAREQAYSAGFAAGHASSEEKFTTETLALEARTQQLLVAAREEWSDEVADFFATRLERSLRAKFDEIAGALARVLAALAKDMRQPAALDALVRQVLAVLRDAPAARIALSGPEDLLSRLESRLPGVKIAARTVADTIDVSLQIDETVLQTQLGVWDAALREALEVA